MLSEPHGAELGDPAQATLIIEDDDPPPAANFSRSEYTATSEDGMATVAVQLSVPSNFQVSVDCAFDEVAQAGITQSGTLVYPPGSLMNSVVITWESTASSEDRTVALHLTRAENATVGATATATLTIRHTALHARVYLPLVTQD